MNIRCKALVMKFVQYPCLCLGSRLVLERRYETVQTARRYRPDHKIPEPRSGAAYSAGSVGYREW